MYSVNRHIRLVASFAFLTITAAIAVTECPGDGPSLDGCACGECDERKVVKARKDPDDFQQPVPQDKQGIGAATGLARGSNHCAAIAISPTTKAIGFSTGCDTPQSARQLALKFCGASDARIIASVTNGWAALVTADNGTYVSRVGSTVEDAMNAALVACHKLTASPCRVRCCAYSRAGGIDASVNYDNDFPQEERAILRAALNYVRYRLIANYVRSNARAVAKRYFFDPDYSRAIGVPADREAPGGLIYRQTGQLLRFRFPDIVLRAYYEQNDYWANAPVGVVKTMYNAATSDDVTGQFTVNVNRYWLGAKGNGSNPEVWAGVLAHEMLHNLGHKHGKDEYGDHLQINAFDAAVRTNGRHKIGDPCPRFR